MYIKMLCVLSIPVIPFLLVINYHLPDLKNAFRCCFYIYY